MPPGVVALLLLTAVGAWHLTEVVHHGDHEALVLFRRAAEAADNVPWIWRLPLTPVRAAACPFCFAHWAAIPFLVGFGLALGVWWPWWLLLWFPSVRLANLLNDSTAGVSRTPNRSRKTLDEASAEELETELANRMEDLDGAEEEDPAVPGPSNT